MQIKSIAAEELTKIANAIRAKTGESDLITLEDMPVKIRGIGGSNSLEACNLVMINSSHFISEPFFLTYTAFENGTLSTKPIENPFMWNDSYDAEIAIVENILKNSSVTIFPVCYLDFVCENAEAQLASESMAEEIGYPIYTIKILGDATVSLSEIY